MKRCKSCNETKSPEEFYQASGTRDGRRGVCITCERERRRRWYQENREEVIEKVTAWQRENRNRYNERQREYKRARPGLERTGHLRRNFGLTQDEFDCLEQIQRGVCAICGRAPKAGKHLQVDHDHDTGEVRGLLCFSCNVGVGNLGNDGRVILGSSARSTTSRCGRRSGLSSRGWLGRGRACSWA